MTIGEDNIDSSIIEVLQPTIEVNNTACDEFTNDEYIIFNCLLMIDFLAEEIDKISDDSAKEIKIDAA